MTRMRRRLWMMAMSLGLALCVPRAARADEAAAVAAESLFREGRALVDKGRFEEACDRFARSQQLDPAVGTLLNLGECFEQVDKLATAWLAYRQATALAVTRNDERRASLARKAAARLEPRLALLAIASPKVPPPGLTVTRNGVRVDPAAFDTPLPVDPGLQTIEATADERKSWQTTVELREGERNTVQIPDLEPTTPVAQAPAPQDEPGDAQRAVAIGLEIGGGAVFATGLVFGALAFARWDSVSEVCPGGQCPSEADRLRKASEADEALAFSTISSVATAVGAVGLVAGVVLHLTAPERRVSVAPLVDRTALGLAVTLGL